MTPSAVLTSPVVTWTGLRTAGGCDAERTAAGLMVMGSDPAGLTPVTAPCVTTGPGAGPSQPAPFVGAAKGADPQGLTPSAPFSVITRAMASTMPMYPVQRQRLPLIS